MRTVKSALFLMMFFISLKAFPQIDFWANLAYFTGCPINHIPEGITVPDKNKQARNVINAIIAGSSYYDLKRQYPDSLEEIISSLIKGKVIERNDEHFRVLFPVLTGGKRNELKKIIHKKIVKKPVLIDSLTGPLNSALQDKPEMVFHFLWSRVIDDCWWKLYNSEFKTDKGPPSIAFIVSPTHPFQCGTNFDYTPDDGQIAISWSYNLFDDFVNLPSTSSFYNLVMNKSVPVKDREFFQNHGLIDSNNVSELFIYHEGDKLDSLCELLKNFYTRQIHGLFDYTDLSKKFQIPPDELFVLMSHEIAYEIFEIIYESGRPVFFPILKETNPSVNFSYLTSIKLAGTNSKEK
jgi:hypothetical protein